MYAPLSIVDKPDKIDDPSVTQINDAINFIRSFASKEEGLKKTHHIDMLPKLSSADLVVLNAILDLAPKVTN